MLHIAKAIRTYEKVYYLNADRALLVVANLAPEKGSFRIDLSRAGLEAGKACSAVDVLTGRPINEVEATSLRVQVEGRKSRLIQIQPARSVKGD